MRNLLLAAGFIALLSYGAYRWWENYDLASKFDVSMTGRVFKVTGLNNGQFNIMLNIKQKFPFDIMSNGYKLTVYFNGNPISLLESSASQLLKANEDSPIILTGVFNPLRMFKTVVNLQTIMNVFNNPAGNVVRIMGTLDISAKGVRVKNVAIDESLPLSDFYPTGQ